jgi:hypothetical protein
MSEQVIDYSGPCVVIPPRITEAAIAALQARRPELGVVEAVGQATTVIGAVYGLIAEQVCAALESAVYASLEGKS